MKSHVIFMKPNYQNLVDSFGEICNELKETNDIKEKMKTILENPWIPLPKYKIVPFAYYNVSSLDDYEQNSLKVIYSPEESMRVKTNYTIVISVEDKTQVLFTRNIRGEEAMEIEVGFLGNVSELLSRTKLKIQAYAKCFRTTKLKYDNDIELNKLLKDPSITINCISENKRREFNVNLTR